MVKYEGECCGCATEAYPCLGNRCPNINVKHLYCDDCKEEVEELYEFDGVQFCKECLLKQFEKITWVKKITIVAVGMSTQTQCAQSTDVLTNRIKVVDGNVLIATNM